MEEKMTIIPAKQMIQKYVFVSLISTFILALMGGAVTSFFISDPIIWYIFIGIILFIWILVFPISAIYLKSISYEITEKSIKIKQGIINKTEQNISFDKVTDFQLYRSLLDRSMGMSTIRIQTAGQAANSTSGYEAILVGILNWSEIYSDLRGKITKETPNEKQELDLNGEILAELKTIRKLLEKR